jgi:uncharacterized protein
LRIFAPNHIEAMKQHLNTVIMSLAILVGVLILARTYHNRHRTNDVISVTGSASQDFESDLIVWSGTYSASNMDIKAGSTALRTNQDAVRAFLLGKGIKEKEIVFSAVSVEKISHYVEDGDGKGHYEFGGYDLSQTVIIESNEVDKVERVSREITDLILQGIEISSNHPDYYYTKLSALKIKMVAAATEDARIRAEQIAEKSNASLGHLRFASMGIFQITAQNSTEDYSWGGSFNTSSRRKTASIAMKLQFGVD